MNRSKFAPFRAFTLIEILVALAIIGILAGLLFPAFSRMRANSYKATCISNLHQLGLATQMYQQDYQCEKIAPNVPLRVDPIVQSYARFPQILECPLDTMKLGYGNSALKEQISDYRNSYIYLGTAYAQQPNSTLPDGFKGVEPEGPNVAFFACQLHGEPIEGDRLWLIDKLNPDGGVVTPDQLMRLYQGTRIRLMPDGHVKTDKFLYNNKEKGVNYSVFFALGS